MIKWKLGHTLPSIRKFDGTLTRKRKFAENVFLTHHGTHLSSFTILWLVSSHFLAILHIFLEKTQINDESVFLIVFISAFLLLGE